MDDIGERMRELGWRQGVVIPAKHFRDFVPAEWKISDQHYLICVSQSCDLVHHELANEPYTQFLLASQRSGISAEFSHGRQPRTIHIKAAGGLCLESLAWQQITVPRECLLSLNAGDHSQLGTRDLGVLTEWLAKRFTRVAFPDGFNLALAKQAKVISQTFKKKHHLFSEVLLRLEPFDELGEGQSYQLACYLLMPPELHGDPVQLQIAQSAASRLEKAFEDSGIEVLACDSVSEEHLSYAELKELVRWDYDYLTHRKEASAEA